VVKNDSSLTVDEIKTGGKTVGCSKRYFGGQMVERSDRKRGCNYTLRMYDSAPMAVEDVINGRIDAAAMDDAPAADAVGKNLLKFWDFRHGTGRFCLRCQQG
jgi:polar amino acid transport system substrate-binding protein